MGPDAVEVILFAEVNKTECTVTVGTAAEHVIAIETSRPWILDLCRC